MDYAIILGSNPVLFGNIASRGVGRKGFVVINHENHYKFGDVVGVRIDGFGVGVCGDGNPLGKKCHQKPEKGVGGSCVKDFGQFNVIVWPPFLSVDSQQVTLRAVTA